MLRNRTAPLLLQSSLLLRFAEPILNLVPPRGIEPRSEALQATAMTTSAKAAKLVQVVHRTTCKAGVCSYTYQISLKPSSSVGISKLSSIPCTTSQGTTLPGRLSNRCFNTSSSGVRNTIAMCS